MDFITFVAGILLTLGCSLYAVFRGDGALRAGGHLLIVMNVVAPIASVAAIWLHIYPDTSNELSDVFTTLIISLGFLYLGYRHGSIWLAPAMAIQGAEFYLLSQMLADNADPKPLMVWNNLISCGVAVALFVGTIASAREKMARRVEPIFRAHNPAASKEAEAVVSEIQDAVFVFHLPQEDAARLMRLASEKRVLPSQYVRDLISTFLEGDHYAEPADEEPFSSAA